jgi:hypothetical protein
LAAVGVVCLQIFQGKAPRASAGGETPPVPAIAPAVPQKNASSSPEAIQPRANEIVGTAIDRRYAQAHLSEWIDTPRRDPFLLEGPASDNTGSQSPSPVALMQLKAIWRQTGGRVAAINNQVYQEGDAIRDIRDAQGKKIEGYKIDKIEGDQVWVDGPRGPERLGFAKPKTSHAPPAGPNPVNPPANPPTAPASGNPLATRS